MPLHPDWIVPDWPAPPNVRAVCTTRAGGVSNPPFDSMNLGDHVGDDPAAVAANRQTLRNALGARPVFLQQVHGVDVITLNAATPDGAVADACLSTTPGVACTMMVADCLPVLITNRHGSAVAAAHAGWRGLAGKHGVGGQGVLEAVLTSFWQHPSVKWTDVAIENKVKETLVWLGPCIGSKAFEVGSEVREAFCAFDPWSDEFFAPQAGGKYLANLPALARRRLAALGVTAIYGSDGSPDWCTFSKAARFHSHRRDSVALGGSGRLAASVWMTP